MTLIVIRIHMLHFSNYYCTNINYFNPIGIRLNDAPHYPSKRFFTIKLYLTDLPVIMFCDSQHLVIRAMMKLLWWLTVTKKWIPLTNMKSEDKATDWYLLRCSVMLTYMDCTWWGLDRVVLPQRETSYFPNIYSDSFTSARDMGQLIMSLFAT